ncbi:unnamed protein product [Chrysoparadoxa australica]
MAMEESDLLLEGPSLKVPAEQLSQVFRYTQKTTERGISKVEKEVAALYQACTAGSLDLAGAKAKLEALLEELNGLRQLVTRASSEEQRYLNRMVTRVQRMDRFAVAGAKLSPTDIQEYNAERLDQWMCDYALRKGYTQTASALAAEKGLQDFVDWEVHECAEEVEKALMNHDCGPAVAWCTNNASKLRRLDPPSMLEFNLRRRAFLELVREKKAEEALNYARDHLSGHMALHSEELQQAMATLAFDQPQECELPEYAALFAEERWLDLVDELRLTLERTVGLEKLTVLELALQCGISALKTPVCCSKQQTKQRNCPVCSEEGQVLARDLPFALQGHSTLICRISGAIMDDLNPPLALPNGQVYAKAALHDMAEANGGKIICPSTGEVFQLSQVRSVFLIS